MQDIRHRGAVKRRQEAVMHRHHLTESIRLQDKGLRGNGHRVMIEKNNLEVAKVVDEWVRKNVK